MQYSEIQQIQWNKNRNQTGISAVVANTVFDAGFCGEFAALETKSTEMVNSRLRSNELGMFDSATRQESLTTFTWHDIL